MTGTDKRAPLLRDWDGDAPAPEAAPAVDEGDPPLAMARAAKGLSRRSGRLARAFWAVFSALALLVLSLAAWDWVTALAARVPVLGWLAGVLSVALALLALVIAAREGFGYLRLARLEAMQGRAAAALSGGDARLAREVAAGVAQLYAGREETGAARARVAAALPEQHDAEGALGLAENLLLVPLDREAERVIEAAARQVALLTAVVPLALLDVMAVLWVNLRMVRALAVIYGGRGGWIGSARLMRAVLVHLAAAGALAMGDDLLAPLAGGSVLSKLSRRFGEGAANGALTVRAGVAAMEVCRPLPFRTRPRPGVAALSGRALKGLFGGEGA
ncbi:MAG: TIGR01620 family protein [Rubellimicrobium sp.]|nr:TIGR01620 family protein [Rubellimicrobium sp.]